jgi:hypothetical protein
MLVKNNSLVSIGRTKKKVKLDVVMHMSNPRLRQKDHEFEASLGYSLTIDILSK